MAPFHTTRLNWPEIGKARLGTGYDKIVTIESAVNFDDGATYNFRLWRDLIPENTMEYKIDLMRNGLAYIKEQFEGVK